MKIRVGWVLVAIVASLSTGCGQGAAGADVSGGQSDYGTTKQMVLDILHSTDGKSAIKTLLQEPDFRAEMAVSNSDIVKGVEAALKTKQSQTFLEQQIKNPEFASAFAKAAEPELTNIQKQLMKDPSYTKDFMVLLKSPEYTQYINQLMQSPQVRDEIMKVMTDALNTPTFRMQFQDALKKAVSESMNQSGGKQSQSESQGGSGGGSSGGGGST